MLRMLSLHIACRVLPIAKRIHRECIINGHCYRFHWNASVLTCASSTASQRTPRTPRTPRTRKEYKSLHSVARCSFQTNLQLCKFKSILLTAFLPFLNCRTTLKVGRQSCNVYENHLLIIFPTFRGVESPLRAPFTATDLQ